MAEIRQESHWLAGNLVTQGAMDPSLSSSSSSSSTDATHEHFWWADEAETNTRKHLVTDESRSIRPLRIWVIADHNEVLLQPPYLFYSSDWLWRPSGISSCVTSSILFFNQIKSLFTPDWHYHRTWGCSEITATRLWYVYWHYLQRRKSNLCVSLMSQELIVCSSAATLII